MIMTRTGEQSYKRTRHSDPVASVWNRQVQHIEADQAWLPAINIYQTTLGIDICVELAGVDIPTLEIQVSQNQVVIQGQRQTPDPRTEPAETQRIISMEISHGPFSRTIQLPTEILHKQTKTQYEHGMLWIRIPIDK